MLRNWRSMVDLDKTSEEEDEEVGPSDNEIILLHEYRDLFIDMAVRNNRSKLAIANRHQERQNFTR